MNIENDIFKRTYVDYHKILDYGFTKDNDNYYLERNINDSFKAIIKYVVGLVLVSLLIFIPAGTLNYFNGWLFIGLLFIPMFIFGLLLFFINPHLLKIRLNAKEKEKEQKEVLVLSGIMFISGFIVASLDYRFKWIY